MVDPKKDIVVASSGPQEVSCGSFERSFLFTFNS